MKTKKVDIAGGIEIKELMYLDFIKLKELKENPEDYTRKIFELSGVSNEISNNLNIADGDLLLREINELNGFVNFQTTSSQPSVSVNSTDSG